MFSWSKYPFLRIFSMYVCGILLAFTFCRTLTIPPFAGIIISLSGLCLLLLFHTKTSYKHRFRYGFLLYILMVWMGYHNTQTCIHHCLPPSSFGETTHKVAILTQVKEIPFLKENSIKLCLNVEHYNIDTTWHLANFSMIIYVQRDEDAENLQYGDRVLFYVDPNFIHSPKNPEEFNYKRYLATKNIYLHAYASKNDWQLLSRKHGNRLKYHAAQLQKKMLHILDSSLLQHDEKAIIAAILLGADDKMDAELIQSFTTAGLNHVLCVSGLHVGIIYMIFNYLLFFLRKNRGQKTVKACLILGIIWFYACLTGLSPSVIRSASMFSFFTFAQIIQRKANTYNSLLSSLVLLTLGNPLVIFDMGLQLSYLAVFGILYLHSTISTILPIKNKVLSYFWNIIGVSIAAQLFTFPLSIYYFHQFPTYFLLANPSIICIIPILIGMSILLSVFSFWPWAYDGLAKLLHILLSYMNTLIHTIELFPFASLQIYLSFGQMLCLYLIIIVFLSGIWYKNKTALGIVLSGLIVFSTVDLIQYTINLRHKEIIFYSLPEGILIDCIDGQHCYVMGDSLALTHKKNMNYHVQNHRIKHRIKSYTPINSHTESKIYWKFNNFISFGGKNILIINDKIYQINYDSTSLKINYLLIDDNPSIQIKKLSSYINPECIIFSPRNSAYRIQAWEKECMALHQAFHSLQQGALKIPLEQP
ncbi:MAG: ComEC/Rec2 family competence protein [Bacteroidales bacterium]|jgi:competence protein ComEC|nr:ComEC/Rec2 family competence protein [Bacteroidales bacterium]MDD2686864.1 ComEC/Rec2 family competence protein [Bacteroidales bacterium]MDD3329791.1 ComEC/Rec2 family competence protein [Bacteroidales bacterium]MDD3690598.1 ComEC/Rec2 family competence protein [Bacteroidales bacterium]MDD4044036.1 ComEC/Rec2 family competence protein [Bacteroidales bacterium]